MANDQYILAHYKAIAKNFGLSSSSTMQDKKIRESETKFFIKEIEKFVQKENRLPQILELGHGNGYLLSVISETFPGIKCTGIEFTPELYELSINRKLSNITLINGDIRKEDLFEKEVNDIVISQRVIINLLSIKQQNATLKNLSHSLKTGGIYLMSESFASPLKELNKAREENSFKEILPSKHNLFLQDSIIPFMEKLDLYEVEGAMPKNYLSTHFYISRVFHEMVRNEGTKKKFSHFSSFFSEALKEGIGNYSPILFRKFLKVKT